MDRTRERPGDKAAAPARGPSNLSKITPPKLQRVVANARLLARLDEAFRARIVWLHGPPGAGKTTLAASFCATRGIAPLWYRLDGGDSDLATLTHYLARAAAQHGATSPPLTPDRHPDAAALHARRVFRALFDTASGTPDALVFDDYHEVDAGAPLHDWLPHGLAEVPDGRSVLIVSRTPPPPSFARLRLNGTMAVLEPDALRMSPAEAEELARERGAAPGAGRIAAITRQTQGWAAGVILMLESTTDAAMPQGLAPVPEVLFDYFAGEILQRMQPQARRLLPMLALLPSMTATHACALTDAPDAADVLEDLRRRNYFTTRDIGTEPRYRFHPLFRDFLATTLREQMPRGKLDTLRIRAAALLDADDQPDAAVGLLGEAGAAAAIADIIKQRARSLMETGRHATLAAWFAKLPQEAIEEDGWLCNWFGEAYGLIDTKMAWSRVSRALARFQTVDDFDGQCLAWAALADFVRTEAFGDYSRYDALIVTMRALLSRHPRIDSPEIMARVAMGMALGLSRRTDARDEIAMWQERARHAAKQASPGRHDLLGFMFAIADLHDAKYGQALAALEALPDPMTAEHMSISTYVSGFIAHSIALVYKVKPGDCAAYVEAALKKCDAMGYHGWSHLLAGLVLHDACGRGDRAASATWLGRMKAYAEPYAADRGAHYHTLAAYHHILHRDLQKARAHGELAVSLAVAGGWPFYEILARTAHVEALIDDRAYAEAEAELDQLDAVLARSATRVAAAGAVFARADLELACGDTAIAHATIARALAMARERGDRRFGLSAARIQRLLAVAIAQKIEPAYVHTLIRDLEVPAPDPLDETWPHALSITTLGGLRVTRGGLPLGVSRKTPKRLILLLKAILAFDGRGVPEAKLIDAVWPDEDGDAARSALTIAIHRLRKLIGDPDAITVSGGTVGLDPARCWVDIWTVEHLLASVSQDAGGRQPRCERVLALYRGDFLAGDEDLPWAAPKRLALRRRFARMIEMRAEAQRDASAAVALYERGIDAAPQAEDLYQALMRRHLAAADARSGLAVFERLRGALDAASGARPGPGSEMLHRKLAAL